MVVVNLYPFGKVVGNPKVKFEKAIENIDIGGPSMLRSAAKNHESVAVVSDPSDYESIIGELKKRKGALSEKTLQHLALKAFQHTSLYDQTISHFLRKQFSSPQDGLPEVLDTSYQKTQILRYGENPHQRAALYQRVGSEPKFSFHQLHGKELSYNNILDLDSAIDVIREFKEPAACVVKHNNPCGVAVHKELPVAIARAVEGDLLSSFGGIVGVNRALDQNAAEELLAKLSFFEVVVAPKISENALQILKQRKNLRVIETPDLNHVGPYDLRYVKSGVLLQDRDQPIHKHLANLRKKLRIVTKIKPSKQEIEFLLFAWTCAKVVRSNAIVLVQGKQTVGIGCGQMSRVDSVKIACEKAGERSRGSLLASDGFFPMSDNIVLAHDYGVRAIIQPGGSIKDQEVIDACDRHRISMVMTGERHFKH